MKKFLGSGVWFPFLLFFLFLCFYYFTHQKNYVNFIEQVKDPYIITSDKEVHEWLTTQQGYTLLYEKVEPVLIINIPEYREATSSNPIYFKVFDDFIFVVEKIKDFDEDGLVFFGYLEKNNRKIDGSFVNLVCSKNGNINGYFQTPDEHYIIRSGIPWTAPNSWQTPLHIIGKINKNHN